MLTYRMGDSLIVNTSYMYMCINKPDHIQSIINTIIDFHQNNCPGLMVLYIESLLHNYLYMC